MLNIRTTLFLFILFLLLSLISLSYADEYKSNRLQIKFNPQNAKVSYWKVLNESISSPHELIDENKSNFGLDGLIEGYSIDYWTKKAGGWNINQNLDEIIFELKSDDLPFELRKFWKFYQNSYQADLSFELTSKKKIRRN